MAHPFFYCCGSLWQTPFILKPSGLPLLILFKEQKMELIIQLILGAVGGNLGGALFKNLSLGTVGNSIAGIVGGGIGGQLLTAVMGGTGGDMLGSVASSGVGGVVLMAVVGMVKKMIAK
jgi:uncharacterized membrane protein YeaQ/YmgE (transglycosylase-associated protein family)